MLAGGDRASIFAYGKAERRNRNEGGHRPGRGTRQGGPVLGGERRAAGSQATKLNEGEAVQVELLAGSPKVGARSSAEAWLNLLLRPVGFAGALQRPDLGVDTHDDGVQRDLQLIRFFRGAQAPRERAGLI